MIDQARLLWRLSGCWIQLDVSRLSEETCFSRSQGWFEGVAVDDIPRAY